jgi:hypothetical protein
VSDSNTKELLLSMANERLQGQMRHIDLEDAERMERGLSCGFRFEAGVYVAHLKWKREKKHYIFDLEVFSLDPQKSHKALMHVPIPGGLSQRRRRVDLPGLKLEVTRSFSQEVK